MKTASELEVDLTDDETADEETPEVGGVTLSQFQAMPRDEKMQFIRSGAALVDDPEVTEPEEKAQETLAERVERELQDLRLNGVIKKELPTITRSTFNSLLPQSRADFLRAGGKLTNDPPPPKVRLPKGAVTLSTFQDMSRDQKLAFCRSGARLFDDPNSADVTRTAKTSELDEMKRKLKIID